MDSDDDDCLRIVDDEELELEVQETAIKEEEAAVGKEEPVQPVAVKEEKNANDGRESLHGVWEKQHKSHLPASLRNRIARSNARSNLLLTADSEPKILCRPSNKPCVVKSRPRISKVHVIKEEQHCDFETALRELSVHDSVDSTTVKEENDGKGLIKDEPIVQRRSNTSNLLGASSSIVGRKLSSFSHPRLREGDRLTKLIEPVATTVQVKRKIPKVTKKTCAAGDSKSLLAGLPRKVEKLSTLKNVPVKTALNIASALKKRGNGKKNIVGEGAAVKNTKVKEASKRLARIPSQEVHRKKTAASKTKAGKQTNAADVTDSDEEDFFYSLKPCRPFDKRATSNDGDGDTEGTEKHLTRAGRRKLTRSLLREGKRMTRPRKVSSYTAARKRMPRIHYTGEESSTETFDSLLRIPVIRAKAVEDCVFEPDERMKLLYEDFQVNVLGEGMDMNVADLEKKIEERVQNLEQKIAEAGRLRGEYERTDVLGTEPFLDALAYRRHPKVIRGDRAMNTVSTTFGMLASQLRFNSCALSQLRGAMCRIKPLQPIIFCRASNNKCQQVADYLDGISGMSERARFRDYTEEWKLARIIEEKIENVKNRMKGACSWEHPTFAEAEQNGAMACSSNASEKNSSFDADSDLNLINDDILCIYDSTKFEFNS